MAIVRLGRARKVGSPDLLATPAPPAPVPGGKGAKGAKKETGDAAAAQQLSPEQQDNLRKAMEMLNMQNQQGRN